jgi:hypothetical protein
MASLVLELQADALNANVRVSDLVRKALVVATKLGIPELRQWCDAELNGYGPGQEVPGYRKMTGQLMARNPFRGWIPVMFEEPAEAELLSKRDLGASIGEVEQLVDRPAEGGTLQMPLPPSILTKVFGDTQEYQMGLVPTLIVSRAGIVAVADAVRNTVLDWSLRLEAEGVLGDGMTFSQQEKERASAITYHIQTFSGVLGNVQGEIVQIGDMNTLAHQLKEKGVPVAERAEIEGILRELPRADEHEKPALIERGKAWLARNADTIGALGKIIGPWLTTGVGG